MKLLTVFLIAAAIAGTTGCATSSRSILLGAGVGVAAGGTTAYLASGHRAQATMIGIATGAAAGSLIGYLIHKDKEKNSTQKDAQSPVDKYPFLTKPEVRSYKVPARIEGNKYIDEHTIYVIDKNTTWSMED